MLAEIIFKFCLLSGDHFKTSNLVFCDPQWGPDTNYRNYCSKPGCLKDSVIRNKLSNNWYDLVQKYTTQYEVMKQYEVTLWYIILY